MKVYRELGIRDDTLENTTQGGGLIGAVEGH